MLYMVFILLSCRPINRTYRSSHLFQKQTSLKVEINFIGSLHRSKHQYKQRQSFPLKSENADATDCHFKYFEFQIEDKHHSRRSIEKLTT